MKNYLTFYLCLMLLFLGCEKELTDINIEIINPVENGYFQLGENIDLEISINQEIPKRYELVIVSNHDGIIIQDDNFSEESSSYKINNLSKNIHNISCYLTDGTNNYSSLAVKIYVGVPPEVTLNELTSTDKTVLLNWTPSLINDFKSYTIYRGINQYPAFDEDNQIGIIEDKNITSFIDSTFMLNRGYFYQVVVNNDNNCSSQSNSPSIEPGDFIVLSDNIEKIIGDPSRHYAYTIAEDYKSVLIINTLTLTVEKKLEFSYEVKDLDIGPNNQILYMAIRDRDNQTSGIGRINLQTQEFINIIPTEYSVSKVEADFNYVYYQTLGSSVRKLNLTNGSEIGISTVQFSGGDIELSPNGNFIYFVETNTSSPRLYKISTLNYNYISRYIPYGFNRHLVLSEDGNYLGRSDYIYSTSNFVTSFDYESLILDINSSSNQALTYSHVVDIVTLDKKQEIPLLYKLGIFSHDDSYVILYTDYFSSDSVGKLFKVNL